MSLGDTKAEIINGAFSKLKISGITVSASPEDTELALGMLESMLRTYKDTYNKCLGYNFEDFPETASKHNMDQKFWEPVQWVLAKRLAPVFGKGDSAPLNQLLVQQAGGAVSSIMSGAATPQQTQYPTRQPIGSGTSLRAYRYRRFYYPQAESPNECATNKMFIDDINNYVEDFNAFLDDSELIDSYTIEANTGLTIVSSAKNSEDTAIEYQIRADGNNETASDSFLRVKIIITTDATEPRKETRIINFDLQSSEI